MKVSLTLSRYLAKTYIFNFLALFFILLGIIYLFDMVELIRRGSKHDNLPLTLMMQMGLLKLPEVGQILLPFAILFSAMFTFWQLTRRSELVVVRAAGFSVWQFLTPVLAVALLIGCVHITIINPMSALLVSKFEQLENTYLKNKDDQIAIFKEGLWLRQFSQEENTDYIIFHAKRIEPPWQLRDISIFYFDKDDSFITRINAQTAQLRPGYWLLEGTKTYASNQEPLEQESLQIATDLTIEDIEDSFSSPETLSFWRLPGHIQTLEETGFDANRLRVHYQNLLSQPIMFIAMVILAACVSMRPPRFRGGFMLVGAGVFVGFIVFFFSSFLQALGSSGQIPVFLAAWSPSLISLLLGISVLMNLEDG